MATFPRTTDPTPAVSRRSVLGLGFAAGAAALLSACGTGATAATGGSGSNNGTLKWGWALPTSWDPVTSSAGWDVHALSLAYAGLTKLDETGTAVPALASAWKYDGRSEERRVGKEC